MLGGAACGAVIRISGTSREGVSLVISDDGQRVERRRLEYREFELWRLDLSIETLGNEKFRDIGHSHHYRGVARMVRIVPDIPKLSPTEIGHYAR
jgi:molybdenum cofactor biosynthesis enzyme MoaA